ncbi:MAG: asparaginase [Actinobacteria bacterium]|nr:asparaginase [Actinomycetota bacterium]
MTLPVLAEVIRSGYVEGSHTGSVIALDADGHPVLALGDVDRPVFPRSSNKPLQAVGLLAQGWQPEDPRQLALATASHSGEEGHLDVVREMLAAAGLDEDALGCPRMLPLNEAAAHALLARGEQASRLTMNCSGKHAAMLAAAVVNGQPTQSYLDSTHPVQVRLYRTLEELAGERIEHVAVDGCGAPQHALSLHGLARAFAGLQREVADAMRENPWHVGGTGRDVTQLMEQVPGLVAKDGAEGVYAVALADGSAVALKIEDGAARARTPVLVAALRRLGVEGLDELATTPVLGGGVAVGEVRVTPLLTA